MPPHVVGVGCVGLRPFEPPRVAELKRLYVSPLGRGRGLGRELSVALLAIARQAGYERVRLGTLPSMGSAQRLLRRAAPGSGSTATDLTAATPLGFGGGW